VVTRRAAHQAFVEATRAAMAEAGMITGPVTCPECARAGATPAQSAQIHAGLRAARAGGQGYAEIARVDLPGCGDPLCECG
jgi:hypothetical protein